MIQSAARIADVAWPLKIVRGVVALYLVFGLTAAVAWLGFGPSAEKQVVDVVEGLSTIAFIFLVPLLLFGLIAVPLHRWIGRKFADFISTQDRDRPKS